MNGPNGYRRIGHPNTVAFRALACVLVIVLFLAPAVARGDHAPGPDKVTLQLRWFHQFQFAGYYAAKAKGFYAEAGLDVTIVERDLKVNPVDAVVSGEATYGVTNSEVLIHRAEGKPVVVLAAIFQHSPLVLVSPSSRKITTPHDLHGRRVLMSTKTTDIELLGMLRKERVSLSLLDVVDRFSREADYYDPEIDAVAAYVTNQPFYLEQKGISYNILYPSSYGIDFYGDCLFTTEEQVVSHPERTRAFREASLRGWEYAMAHPEEIADIILKEYGTKKSREHLLYEARAIDGLMLPELVEIGHMNPGRWTHIAEEFRNQGITDFVPAMDGFLYDPRGRDVEGKRLQYFLYVLMIVALALALGTGMLGYFNRRLQRVVDQRTIDLSVQAAELQEANARLRQLDKVKSALLSSVSHELRTPLTSVLGFVKLVNKEFEKHFAPLATGDDNLERRRLRITKNLTVVAVEGERLTRLIADVLDLARIESGNVVWRDKDFSVDELSRNAVAVVQELFARNPDTALLVDIEEGLPILHADPDRIIQVLINLLTNAAKFTPRGEVRFTVRRIDDTVRMDVADTGVGIPEKEVGDIFNMFHQVWREDTINDEHHGAGLGLAICKEIVEHYNGTISVVSTQGRGSTFTVRLPIPQ